MRSRARSKKGRRRHFESRFGVDFSTVQLHHDDGAADLAARLNARAFTVGNDIFLGADNYRPHSHDGRRLIAHELTHVVQQRRQPGRDIVRREPAAPSPVPESRPVEAPPVKAVEFDEHPSEPYHGFDRRGSPLKTLTIPDGGSRKITARIEPTGSVPVFQTPGLHPLVVTPDSGSGEFIVRGTFGGDAGQWSEVRVTDQTGNVLERLGVLVLPHRQVSVGYHLMSDPPNKMLKGVPIARTDRSLGDEKALTDKLNDVWQEQANIGFTAQTVTDR